MDFVKRNIIMLILLIMLVAAAVTGYMASSIFMGNGNEPVPCEFNPGYYQSGSSMEGN